VEEIKTHIFDKKNVSSENRDGKETMWKSAVACCKVWLGVEVL
jgi:hypothetical protein